MLNKFNKIQIARSFNRAAKSYNQASFLQCEVGDKLFRYFNVEPLKIIDLGCGTGIITSRLARSFPNAKVLGIDIADNMIQHACEQFSEEGNLSFICADADNLPVENESIDLIFSNLMLQWSPNLKTTFNELHRVLKPQGHLIFSTFGTESLNELRGAWAKIDDYAHLSNFIGKEQLMLELDFSRLKILKLETLYHRRSFDTVYDLMTELKMLGAHNLNENRSKGCFGKKKFKQLQAFYDEHRDDNNKLPATFEIHYVYASK